MPGNENNQGRGGFYSVAEIIWNEIAAIPPRRKKLLEVVLCKESQGEAPFFRTAAQAELRPSEFNHENEMSVLAQSDV